MQTSETIDTMISSMAHEIKNPLSLIKANVDTLKNTNVVIDYKNNIDVMEIEINKIDNIVNGFLKYVKEKDILKDEIYLKDVIEKVILDNKSYANNIKFSVKCDNENICIIGAEYHFYIIFSNIIKNSIDAINEKSNKSSDDEINIEIVDYEGIGVIKVSDTGIGLTKNKESNKKYYSSKKTQINNSGFGLNLIKNMVTIYKGEFQLSNNEINNGCIATIKIPLS